MQSTISPGLQKLMQSVQELKQVSSPQTSSGAPTIAAQVEQAASQVASQAAPSAEMPGMLPNDPYRAQLMQTLQAKAQEQAQRMAMLAQGQQPQGRAEGGIASLPADVEMAEGGVVGFSGEFGSVVPEVEALDALRVAEAKRKRDIEKLRQEAETLELFGALQAPEARARLSQMEGAPVAEAPKKKEPPARPPATARPTTSQATPATPASTGMIDYAKGLQRIMDAQEQGFKGLEALLQPQPKTQEELDFVKRQEEEVARRRAGLDSRRQQFLDLERMREEAGRTSKIDDIASFLSKAGGRSLFAGLGQATRAMEPIEAARRKEAQAALDRKREYFDLLEQQRDAIEDRDVAIRQGQMDRAKAAQDKIEAIKKAFASLRVTTSTQMYGPTLQAGQSAADTQARIASAEKLARDRNAALVAAARARGTKPPPGMGIGDLETLQKMVSAEFNSKRPGPQALAFLNSIPNGGQLVRDIQNGNIKPGSPQWEKEVTPKLLLGAEVYKQSLLRQTKFGAQPIPYGAAAAALGVSPAADEDED
jgi:hypothetical protein